MAIEFLVDDLAGLVFEKKSPTDGKIGNENNPIGYRDRVDPLRVQSSGPHKAQFTYGPMLDPAILRSDLQRLEKRFSVQQWPVRDDWPDELRQRFADRFKIDVEATDVPLSIRFRDENRGPEATGLAYISLHPTPHLARLEGWSTTCLPLDPSPAIDEICLRLTNRIGKLLKARMSLEDWAALKPTDARQTLLGVRRGRPLTEEQEWLNRAKVAAEAPASKHWDDLMATFPNQARSTIQNWLSRMKQDSNHPDKLRNPLLYAEGPTNRPILHLTDYAVAELEKLQHGE